MTKPPSSSEPPPTDGYPDLIVLGAGSGGYACALRAAELGLRVVLVEKDKIGGTCLHRGCIPTKAFLHAAEIADGTRAAAQFGVRASLEGIDPDGVLAYADAVVSRLYKGLTGLVAARSIEVVNGEGRIERDGDAVAVRVGDRRLRARHVVLATGSYARTLPGIDVDGTSIITSDHGLRLTRLPASAIVLGGGVIGVEFASLWRSFGVEVTIVETLPRLVPAEDPQISKALERAFRKRGITFLTDAPAERVGCRPEGGVTVTVAGQDLSAELLLMAVGRGPATAEIGCAEAGIELERGFVVTDERLRTSVPGVYAVGDLVSGLQLAHRGFAHGIFVAEEIAHALGRFDAEPAPVRDVQIPRVTYCDPEIASVGLSEDEARRAYPDVETLTYDLAGNGRSQILRTQGFVKLVRAVDGPVVGVHLIGARVGELVGEAQLITGWEAFPDDVAPLVHAHPTQNEALGEAHLALAGKPLHMHP